MKIRDIVEKMIPKMNHARITKKDGEVLELPDIYTDDFGVILFMGDRGTIGIPEDQPVKANKYSFRAKTSTGRWVTIRFIDENRKPIRIKE